MRWETGEKRNKSFLSIRSLFQKCHGRGHSSTLGWLSILSSASVPANKFQLQEKPEEIRDEEQSLTDR